MPDDIYTLTHFWRKLLENIRNERSEVKITLHSVRNCFGDDDLQGFLQEISQFPSPGVEHSADLLGALKILMQDNEPDLNAEHFQDSQSMLDAYLNAYRGCPIHIAAVLQRTDVISEMLTVAAEYGLGYTKQLTVTDNCLNTALYSLMLTHNGKSELYLKMLNDCDEKSARGIVQQCIFQASRLQLIFKVGQRPDDIVAMLDSLRSKTSYWDSDSSLTIFYHFRKAELSLLEKVIHDQTQYDWIFHVPNPFHFTVAIYAEEGIDAKRNEVLYLLHSKWYRNGWMNGNAICVMNVGRTTQCNGTAAHFALLNYQPSHLKQIHPGFVRNSELLKPAANGCDKASSYVEMLEHLQDVYGINLLKQNHDQKTPLDCLPPDADPSLIQVFLDLYQRNMRIESRDVQL